MFHNPTLVLLTLLLIVGCGSVDPEMESDSMKSATTSDPWAPLSRYIESRLGEFDAIPGQRKVELDALADFVSAARDTGVARLNFICTHNSRRSHFGQVWAQVAAYHFGVDSLVETYSGGTEATAFNERAVGALRRTGLDLHAVEISDNPKYAVHYAADRKPLVCFSKQYSDPEVNPLMGFAAVMTCSDADRSCPLVHGAAARFSTPYEDPKSADGSEGERAAYDARCAQIACEMLYMMSRVQP